MSNGLISMQIVVEWVGDAWYLITCGVFTPQVR